MRGRDLILENITKTARQHFYMGIGFFLAFGAITVFCILGHWKVYLSVVSGIMAAFGIFLMIEGFMVWHNPYKNNVFKRNPHLLEMADELYGNIIYEDAFIILSERLFAPKKETYYVCPRDEVYWVYLEKQSMNFVPTGKSFWFVTARVRFALDVTGKKREEIDRTMNVLAQACSNLRVGYTNENMVYADRMQKQWKERHPHLK